MGEREIFGKEGEVGEGEEDGEDSGVTSVIEVEGAGLKSYLDFVRS